MSQPAITVVDVPEESRYVISVDGEPAGFTQYKPGPGRIAFLHTEIDPSFGGRGVGGALARFVLDDARTRGLAVLPYCPFIKSWITQHPDYLDLVPAARRPDFNL